MAVQNNKTLVSHYKYDTNYHTDRGERVFAGNFTGLTTDLPELLIYNKSKNSFYYKNGNDQITEISSLVNIDLDDENLTLLNNGITKQYYNNKDVIVYHIKEADYSGDIYHFYAIYHDGNTFQNYNFANINGTDVASFNPGENLFTIAKFEVSAESEQRLIVLDHYNNTPKFVLYGDTITDGREYIDIDSSGAMDSDYFKRIRENPSMYKIFSGKFTSSSELKSAEVLLVDMTGQYHKWYLGDINYSTHKITFTALTGNVQFASQGYTGQYHIIAGAADGNMIYSRTNSTSPVFYKLQVNGDSINQQLSYAPPGALSFKNEYDHENNPVVHTSGGLKKVQLLTNQESLVTLSPSQSVIYTNIDRSDLINQVYVFRWIQGDYNGDGKTDIGIFHLKERYWYYAMTQGTVPDMIYRVKNGIGGTYEMKYVNSSSFDNTGEDDIPDLPMNYKVCSKLIVDDGFGKKISSYYEYKDGYAFSDFINGYKETDFFGFGEFIKKDILGNKTINKYYNVPFDDFRKNRALAGAIKESRFIGGDAKEYSRTEHEYKIHEIVSSDQLSVTSYLIEPVEVKKFMRGTLIQTTKSNIVLTANNYEMVSKSESVTDHYKDEVHSPVTVTAYTEFDNIESTNEMRLKFKEALDGTSHETTTSYEYDSKGNVITETLSYTGTGLESAPDRVMQYEYDDYGNRKKETNASGEPVRVVEKIYDSRLHQFLVQDRAIGPVVLTNNYEINYGIAFGGVEKKTGPNGNSTYYEFDEFGRLNKQFADTDSGKDLLASYTYSTDFPLSGKVTQHTGNGNEIETRTYADGMGRVIHSVRSALDVPGKRYTKTGILIYDAIGRVIRKSQTHWADDDEIDTFRKHVTEKHSTITDYDSSGRVKKVTLPEGFPGEDETSISYTYNDPYEVIETHSVGRSKRTVKNGRGLVLYVEDSGFGDDGKSLSAKIGFAYDLTGKRVKKMDLNSNDMTLDVPEQLFQVGAKDESGYNIAVWKYDGMGQLIESSDPDLGYSQVVYNVFGEVVESLDANNRLITMEYDSLGRIIVKHLPDEGGDIEYIYDSYPGCENALGRAVHIKDLAQSKTFSYDRMGRVKRENRVIHADKGTRYVTDYQFDLLNRKTLIIYPGDPLYNARMKVRYSHSAMGVVGITTDHRNQGNQVISGIEYNEFGQMSKVTRGNKTSTEYMYDIKGRLERLTTISMSDGIPKKIQDVIYEFKVDNSIKSVMNTPEMDSDGDVSSSVRYEYTYDGLNRLVKALGDYQKSGFTQPDKPGQDPEPIAVHKQFERGYEYALNGNMKGKTIYDPESHSALDSWRYFYAGKNHAVTGISTTKHGGDRFSMVYDEVGNMIFQRDAEKNLTKSIEYDSFNRIKKVVDPDTGDLKGEYEYDDQGFRVRKFAVKQTEDDLLNVEILYPSMYFGVEKNYKKNAKKVESVSAVNNIYLNGIRIAAVGSDNKAKYFLTDQIDSVKVVTDDSGDVVTRMEYLPYGETWFQEGDESNAPKFNSQELDSETNFYYYNARFYDPSICRFVTADTVIDGEGSAAGWNRFSYVKNNPIIYKDPTGHKTKENSRKIPQNQGGGYQDSSNKSFAKHQNYMNKTFSHPLNDQIGPATNTADSLGSGFDMCVKEIQTQRLYKSSLRLKIITSQTTTSIVTGVIEGLVNNRIKNKNTDKISADEIITAVLNTDVPELHGGQNKFDHRDGKTVEYSLKHNMHPEEGLQNLALIKNLAKSFTEGPNSLEKLYKKTGSYWGDNAVYRNLSPALNKILDKKPNALRLDDFSMIREEQYEKLQKIQKRYMKHNE
jgi:RHS repeat-associated protein